MTQSITILQKTGNFQIDRLLVDLITEYETELPGCISGYYILGSYADFTNIGSSDLDMHLVLHPCQPEALQRAHKLAQTWVANSPVELDIEIEEEVRLLQGVPPNFKYGSILFYGQDIRDKLPLIPLPVWTRDRMHSSYWRTVHLFTRPTSICLPLNYPDSQVEFFGYTARLLRLPDGREVPCTRDLIRLVGWSATAILAWKAGKYVARKKDCHRLYQESFTDEWGQFLQDVYEKCRGRWNYLIPQNITERQELRALCARTLDFENHFLQMYKLFLLEELLSIDPEARHQALWVLEKIPYEDQEVKAAVTSKIDE